MCQMFWFIYLLQSETWHSSIRMPACWCEIIKERNKQQLCVMLQHWNDHLWVKPGSFACSIWSCVELHYLYTGTLYKNAIHHIPGFPCAVLLQKPSFSSAPRLLEVQLWNWDVFVMSKGKLLPHFWGGETTRLSISKPNEKHPRSH